MIQQILAIWSLVPLAFLKPTWTSGRHGSRIAEDGLDNFEHYFTSVWDECNCAVVWAFYGIAFLWDWNENWPFPVLGHNDRKKPLWDAQGKRHSRQGEACLFIHLSNCVVPCCCSSVSKSCLTLCNPMDSSPPGFPVLHPLLEFVQTHVYWVGGAIHPSHPLSPPSPPVRIVTL